MKYIDPNVIIIDDRKDEIQGILNYYNEKGLGCKWFDASETGDTMPVTPFNDISILFLDLYYTTSVSEIDVEQCSLWVKSIIQPKSFYILIIWTRDIADSNSIIERLNKLDLRPFCILVKNKSEYQIPTEEKYNYTRLFLEINNYLDSLPALDEIFIWKKNIKTSTNKVIGNLTNDLKIESQELFIKKLKNILISHGGNIVKQIENSHQKRYLLFDAFDSVLISNSKYDIKDEIQEVTNSQIYSFKDGEMFDIDKELNSWFHFKLTNEISEDLIYPGIISMFKENDWKMMYSLHDDKIVQDYLAKQNEEDKKQLSISLLISRPCDLAQYKYGKNLKLLSGLIISDPLRKKNKLFSTKPIPASIIIYDNLYLNDNYKDVSILFDLRYTFSVPEKVFIEDFVNLKLFNKELISEIQMEYSSYSSKLGITKLGFE